MSAGSDLFREGFAVFHLDTHEEIAGVSCDPEIISGGVDVFFFNNPLPFCRPYKNTFDSGIASAFYRYIAS